MSLKVKFNIPREPGGEKKKKRRVRHRRADYLLIDIGTSTDFVVKMDKGTSYDIIHESKNSLLARLIEGGNYTDVVVVRWGDTHTSVSDKDHISASIASDVVCTPKYTGKKFYTVEGKHVSVAVRSFIPGVVLSTVIKTIEPEKLQHIQQQVAAIVFSLGQKTTSSFGRVRSGRLRTKTAKAYIAQCILTEKLSGNKDAKDTVLQVRDDSDVVRAVFCHRNISPDHVILSGVEVVGLVGWSAADYIPEFLDRTQYSLKSTGRRRSEWYDKLSKQMYTQCDSIPTLELFDEISQYCFIVDNRTSRQDCTLPGVSDDAASGNSSAGDHGELHKVRVDGDAASLESLTNETIDTWERSVATTIA